MIRVKVARKHPRMLTVAEVQAILNGCDRLRDRFLSPFRMTQACELGDPRTAGLDRAAPQRQRRPVQVGQAADDPRECGSGPAVRGLSARSARRGGHDYVFVNLWGEPRGHPLSYAAVSDLVRRLRRRTGVDFDPHWYRHT